MASRTTSSYVFNGSTIEWRQLEAEVKKALIISDNSSKFSGSSAINYLFDNGNEDSEWILQKVPDILTKNDKYMKTVSTTDVTTNITTKSQIEANVTSSMVEKRRDRISQIKKENEKVHSLRSFIVRTIYTLLSPALQKQVDGYLEDPISMWLFLKDQYGPQVHQVRDVPIVLVKVMTTVMTHNSYFSNYIVDFEEMAKICEFTHG
jgi:hypothetical protein